MRIEQPGGIVRLVALVLSKAPSPRGILEQFGQMVLAVAHFQFTLSRHLQYLGQTNIRSRCRSHESDQEKHLRQAPGCPTISTSPVFKCFGTAFTTSSGDASKQAARSHRQLQALLPSFEVSLHLREKVFLLYPSGKHLPSQVRAFIDFLVETSHRDAWSDGPAGELQPRELLEAC